MTSKQFIEKAIEGGYAREYSCECTSPRETCDWHIESEDMLWILDPKAWEAVGKVEGWASRKKATLSDFLEHKFWEHKFWEDKMHQMIDALKDCLQKECTCCLRHKGIMANYSYPCSCKGTGTQEQTMEEDLEMVQQERAVMTPEKLASLFHDTYETFAPVYGYETRKETRNFDLDSKNGKLMVAVCTFILNTEFTNLINNQEEV